MVLSFSGALPNGTTATTQSAGDNTTKVATDAFVTTAIANAIAGVNPAVAVQAATATVLPNTPTYNNGVSGVGATLTAGVTNTALVVDGYTPALLDRILVKNQASAFQNGVYYVSQLAALGLAWILTRALDYDQPSDINNTGAIPVVNGTANASTQWVLTSAVTTIGTDSLTYTQFTIAPANTLQTGGTNPTNHGVLIGEGTNVVTSTSSGTSGQVLTSNGASTDPTFQTGPAIQLISEVVTSGSQATVAFSSISASYRDLIVRVRGRGDASANNVNVQVRFNGDSGANYDYYYIQVHGSTTLGNVSGLGSGSAAIGDIPAANAPASTSGGAELTVFDYRGTTFFKSGITQSAIKNLANIGNLFSESGGIWWANTAAINGVTVLLSGGNFVNGSVVSLYGSL